MSNYNSKNQIHPDNSMDNDYLNDKIEHRNQRLNFLHSQLGQIGIKSLEKTIEYEKRNVLGGSKKLAKLEDYLSSKKDHHSTISYQSLPKN